MKAVFDKLPPEVRERQAFLNGSLQGAYLLLAARAPRLDFEEVCRIE